MAILSILVFGAAFAVSVYTIYATIRPELERIADLLAHGPAATPMLAPPVPARSTIRNVRVRSLPTTRSPLRAAA